MTNYCEIANGHPIHGPYHDNEHGYPQKCDSTVFERFSLEVMQTGLSWLIILKKRSHIQNAFSKFCIDKVSKFQQEEVNSLMKNDGIIRNKRKITAIIENARKIQILRKQFGSFINWVDYHHPLSQDDWVTLFRENFKFAGYSVTTEFLMSTGYLPGAHKKSCPAYKKIKLLNPPWYSSKVKKS